MQLIQVVKTFNIVVLDTGVCRHLGNHCGLIMPRNRRILTDDEDADYQPEEEANESDNEAEEDGELSFKRDEIVVVTKRDVSGWGVGYVESKPEEVGMFPLNRTETIES